MAPFLKFLPIADSRMAAAESHTSAVCLLKAIFSGSNKFP